MSTVAWAPSRKTRPAADRLMEKVAKSDSGCWIFTGYVTPSGYGQFWFEGRRNEFAHRAAYTLFVGPIPEGLQLDHLCRNRACCNPDHLEPVTCRENLLRGEGVTAKAARVSTCPKGHPYSGGNLYLRPDGKGRGCRECRSTRDPQAPRHALRRKIRASLDAHPEWTDLEHALRVGCNRKTVAKVRTGHIQVLGVAS